VLEDAAEAHLARHRGRAVGGLSQAATFSFYGNKILTCGEGGAVTLSDPALERRARLLRGQGMDPARRYWFPVVGHNFRLTNVACALLCAQLERHEEILAKRRAVFERYRARLADVPGIALQPHAPWAEPVPWLFCVTVEEAFGRTRDELAAGLEAAGIETRPFFHPLHHLPPYERAARERGHAFPVTERLARTGLSLPTFNAMTPAQVDRVCDAVRAARR
jgi:perosamine synthetase